MGSNREVFGIRAARRSQFWPAVRRCAAAGRAWVRAIQPSWPLESQTLSRPVVVALGQVDAERSCPAGAASSFPGIRPFACPPGSHGRSSVKGQIEAGLGLGNRVHRLARGWWAVTARPVVGHIHSGPEADGPRASTDKPSREESKSVQRVSSGGKRGTRKKAKPQASPPERSSTFFWPGVSFVDPQNRNLRFSSKPLA